MTKELKGVTVEVKPVSMTGEVVNKWQAMVRIDEGERTRVIAGDPMADKEESVYALLHECANWDRRLRKARLAIDYYKDEHKIY